MYNLPVRPLSFLEKWADKAMVPLMKILIFLQTLSWQESPQRTHRWNHSKLGKGTLHLSDWLMVYVKGDREARRSFSFLIHFPLTGWRDYVVLEPAFHQDPWYVGWVSCDSSEAGVSRVPVEKKVKMLLGPGNVLFFGVDAATGREILLKELGRGRLGQRISPYQSVPLH